MTFLYLMFAFDKIYKDFKISNENEPKNKGEGCWYWFETHSRHRYKLGMTPNFNPDTGV